MSGVLVSEYPRGKCKPWWWWKVLGQPRKIPREGKPADEKISALGIKSELSIHTFYWSSDTQLATGGDRSHCCQDMKTPHSSWRSPPKVQHPEATERRRARISESGRNTEHPWIHQEDSTWDEQLQECLKQTKIVGDEEQVKELSQKTKSLQRVYHWQIDEMTDINAFYQQLEKVGFIAFMYLFIEKWVVMKMWRTKIFKCEKWRGWGWWLRVNKRQRERARKKMQIDKSHTEHMEESCDR